MERVRIDDVDARLGPAAVKRGLTDPLGATDVSINYYELAPGDSFAFGYHYHGNQEEVFYVQSGTVTFETEDGPLEVGAGEVVRFAPGEYQRGRNEGEERVVALALGAPQETGEGEILRECSACGGYTPQSIERAEGGDALVATCAECGATTGRFVRGEER